MKRNGLAVPAPAESASQGPCQPCGGASCGCAIAASNDWAPEARKALKLSIVRSHVDPQWPKTSLRHGGEGRLSVLCL